MRAGSLTAPRLLVLGGTKFVGRAVVDAALAAGHDVTLFTRGSTNPGLFPEAEHLVGDRDGGLDALAGGEWDAVVDTSGYVPRVVADSARLLADRVGWYVFVSTTQVYARLSRAGTDERVPTRPPPEPPSEDSDAHYGPLKSLCEVEVERAIPTRSTIIRAGMIAGPRDPNGACSYWPVRAADGGEVLGPGDPTRPIQLLDVRDLAAWTLVAASTGAAGTFNAVGPTEPIPMGDYLEACVAEAGSDARIEWVEEAFLLDRGLVPFQTPPLWLSAKMAGLGAVDAGKAIAAGLRLRPAQETIRDTLAWWRDDPVAHRIPPVWPRREERRILEEWHASRP